MIKKVRKIAVKDSDLEDIEFWRQQSPQARLSAAFAILRQVIDVDHVRLERVVTKRPLRGDDEGQ